MKGAYLVCLLSLSLAVIDVELHPIYTPEEQLAQLKSVKTHQFLENLESSDIPISDVMNA
jgi:hypothetical protein